MQTKSGSGNRFVTCHLSWPLGFKSAGLLPPATALNCPSGTGNAHCCSALYPSPALQQAALCSVLWNRQRQRCERAQLFYKALLLPEDSLWLDLSRATHVCKVAPARSSMGWYRGSEAGSEVSLSTSTFFGRRLREKPKTEMWKLKKRSNWTQTSPYTSIF